MHGWAYSPKCVEGLFSEVRMQDLGSSWIHRGGYNGSQYVQEDHSVEREPQTAWERALLLLRATLLPGWQPTASQGLVWAIRGTLVLGVIVLIASAAEKSLWEWLNLLIVPAVLAVGGYLFNSSQNRAAQEAAERRAQDEALQAYLDQMSDMLIATQGPPSLYKAHPGDGLSEVARARTLIVLTRLDGSRKARVLRFLYEAGLITKGKRVLALGTADLRRADLSEAFLAQVDLRTADLGGADLRRTNLHRGYMSGVNLNGADLRGAYLGRTNLNGAYLPGADLSDAKGVTNDQLHKTTRSLERATMPSGQKYEDWLKDKEGTGDDE